MIESSNDASVIWKNLPWKKYQKKLFRLQKFVYEAIQVGDKRKATFLQRLILKSTAARTMAVRQVTQLNAGKKTAGVDGKASLSFEERLELIEILRTAGGNWHHQKLREISIPKKDGTFRTLKVPTVRIRCLQAMVKNALEPHWEAIFERSSYGFRPGRSPHDAIEKVYGLARPNKTKKWVADADIKGAFDNISHEFLLKAVGNFPARELIKQWLKAGYMEQGQLHQTIAGTPQGGVISPLLANVALHGMEAALKVKYDSRGYLTSSRAVVRFADDFVVFCETKAEAETSLQILTEWLAVRGLELSPEKTRIVHLNEGFEFLGFHVRQYKDPFTKTGWKLLIKPSKQAVQALRNKLRAVWNSLKGQNVKAVIKQLNPIIRGWANYFRTGVAREIFQDLDRWMFRREVRYVNRSHPKKNRDWKDSRYWGRLNPDRFDRWVFGDKDTGIHLLKFRWFRISRHILVKGLSSPDDSNLRGYWQLRNQAKASVLMPSKQKLAQRQKGLCPVCGESLFNSEELQVHHKIPSSQGGKDNYGNLQLVHIYCHQQLHAGPGAVES